MNRADKLKSECVDSSEVEKLLKIHQDKEYLGKIGDEEFIFYCDKYDQVYIYDILSDIDKTLTLEEYENLVSMSYIIANRFKENEKKRKELYESN